MLEQQKLYTVDNSFDNVVMKGRISRIQKQCVSLNQFIKQIRQKKYSSYQEIPNDSEISQILQASDKISFQLQLPTDRTVKKFNTDKNLASPAKIIMKDKDDGLKMKPRTSVNGRDDLKGKIFNQSKTYNLKLSSIRQTPIEQKTNVHKKKQDQQKMQLVKQQKINHSHNVHKHIDQQTKYNFRHQIRKFKQVEDNGINQKRRKIQSKNIRDSSVPVQIHNPQQVHSKVYNFSTDRKNIKKISRFTKIVPQKLIQEFFTQHTPLKPDSEPRQIYQYFTSLCQYFKIQNFNQPLIKRYRNCVYFGQRVPPIKLECYEGMLWYYRGALYYGNFQAGRKQGKGVQVDIQNFYQIWKGNFLTGTKNGHFEYTSSTMKYSGMMKHGIFHGQGELKTQKSTYQGNFINGMKQGYGQEHFHKGQAHYKGEYIQNEFNGQGQLQSKNYFYKGSFFKNLAHGYGFERTSEFEYKGEFKKGKKDGKGTIKMNDGTIFQGIFKDGKAVQEEMKGSSYNKNFRITQSKNSNNRKYKQTTSQILIQLSQQNQDGTLDYHESRKSVLKKPQYYEYKNEFPRDAEENQQDPLEQKII